MSRYKELIGLNKLVPALAGSSASPTCVDGAGRRWHCLGLTCAWFCVQPAFACGQFVFDQVTYRKIFGGTKMKDMPTMSQEYQAQPAPDLVTVSGNRENSGWVGTGGGGLTGRSRPRWPRRGGSSPVSGRARARRS